jgi:hypothetical protein
MGKCLAADNGHKQSGETAVVYDSDLSEGVQVKGLLYFNRK